MEDQPQLPVGQLESLKFKINQILESMNQLRWTLHMAMEQNTVPSWPEILSKYNILLSQTHSLSSSLVAPIQTRQSAGTTVPNPYEQLVVHPKSSNVGDGKVLDLLRTLPSLGVYEMENESVRRLSGHMSTRGSVGVLSPVKNAPATRFGASANKPEKKPEYEDVLAECQDMQHAHDRRVERAVRAIALLNAKYEWKQRVQVEVEEPEELDWDPRFAQGGNMDVDSDESSDDGDEDEVGEQLNADDGEEIS